MARKIVKKATTKTPSVKTKGELVVLTGLSGSGKLSALKAFEDLGFLCGGQSAAGVGAAIRGAGGGSRRMGGGPRWWWMCARG